MEQHSDSLTFHSSNKHEHSLSGNFYDNRMVKIMVFNPVSLKFIHRRTNPANFKKYTTDGEEYNMCFKMIRNDAKLVKTLLFSYGFLHCSPKNMKCNLVWANTHLGNSTLRTLKPWQRVNHFPRSWMITRKDSLYINIDRAATQYGKDWFDFIPTFFYTPLSEIKRVELIKYVSFIGEGKQKPLIVKPAGSSLGRGIYFLSTLNQIESLEVDKKLLISQYIDRPYLLNGLKWDLRVYVLVTSFYPLICYIYADGLARFAVNEYSKENESNYADVNTHLTNYSLNKQSSRFIKNKDVASENVGHKWTLGALLRELERQGVDVELLMIRIEDIVVKTLLSIQGPVSAVCRKVNLHPSCAFELFGFDILVDEDLKPWLLEVNLSPSLICDAPLDSVLKTSLLCDVLNVASIPYVQEKNKQNKLFDPTEVEDDGPLDDNASIISDQSATMSYTSDSACDSALVATTSAASSDKTTRDVEIRRLKLKLRHRNMERKAQNFSTNKVNRNKIRKIQSPQKMLYSSNNKNPQYQARAKLYHDKLKSELHRKGRFIPVFPRKMTWYMYSFILEDVGDEKWDEDLHNRLIESEICNSSDLPHVTMEDIRNAHHQMINAKMYKTKADLTPVVRDVLLKEAFVDAKRYKMRMYSADVIPYPSSLPRVRSPARRRTRSEVEVENEREKIRELLRQQLKEDGELLSCKNKENLVDKDNDINSDLHIIDLQPSVHPQRFDASLISQSANHLTS